MLLAISVLKVKERSIALARGYFSRLSRGLRAACMLALWAAPCRALAAAVGLCMHDEGSSAGHRARWHRHSGNSPLPTTSWPMLTEARPKRTSTASGCPGSRWPLPLRPGLVPHPVVCSAPVLLPGFSPHFGQPLPAWHTHSASPPALPRRNQLPPALPKLLPPLVPGRKPSHRRPKSRPVGKTLRFPEPGQGIMVMRGEVEGTGATCLRALR